MREPLPAPGRKVRDEGHARRRLSSGRETARRALVLSLVFLTSEAGARGRPPLPRWSGRLQLLGGAGLTLPADAAGERRLVAYVPTDLELAVRVAAPLSLVMGGVGYLAPFSQPTCAEGGTPRPHGLGALLGLRLDLNNSRDGSWWSPWLALRGGVVGQAGVLDGPACAERFVTALLISPRIGADLWMGPAAVSFALGYDFLPRADAVSVLIGLTVRLF